VVCVALGRPTCGLDAAAIEALAARRDREDAEFRAAWTLGVGVVEWATPRCDARFPGRIRHREAQKPDDPRIICAGRSQKWKSSIYPCEITHFSIGEATGPGASSSVTPDEASSIRTINMLPKCNCSRLRGRDCAIGLFSQPVPGRLSRFLDGVNVSGRGKPPQTASC